MDLVNFWVKLGRLSDWGRCLQDMATQDYFSHTSLDGRSPWDRARDQGISADGENIAAGYGSPSQTLQQWKDSDGHCKNMMNPNFHVVAIGYGHDPFSTYKFYWTQMFKSSDVSDLDTSCYPTSSKNTTLPTTNTETDTTSITETTTATTASSTTTTTTTATETGSTTTFTTTGTGTATGTTTGTVTSTATGTATGATTGTVTSTATGAATSTTAGTVTSTAASTAAGTTTGTATGIATDTSTSTGIIGSALTASDTSTTFSSSTSSQIFQSSSAASNSTQPEEGTTTAVFESVEGKLVLEVSDPERFLAASTELKGQISNIRWMIWEVQRPDCQNIWKVIITYRRKFRSQTSENMDRWKSRGEKNQTREEHKREDQTRERVRRKKMQVCEKVAKSRNTVFFKWFGALDGRKVGSLKRRAEPCGQMIFEQLHAVVARGTFPSQNVQSNQSTPCPDHFWKLRCRKSARRCGAKHIWKSKVLKTGCFGVFLEVVMSKECTPLWRKAHLEVKSVTSWSVGSTSGSWDVEKVHTAVARSTFTSQNAQSTSVSDHFWKLRCRKSARRCGAKHMSKSKCIKMRKAHHSRTTFGSSHIEKVDAVMAESTFPHQNVKSTTCSDQFWRFRSGFAAWQAQGILHLDKKRARREGFVAFPKMMAGVGHLKRIWKDARNMFIRDVRRSGRWFPERLHFGASDLQVC